jgi:hypothetical protein
MSPIEFGAEEPDLGVTMRQCSADAVRLAEEKFQITLDGSHDSIRDLERLLEIQHRAIPKGIFKYFRKAPREDAIARFGYLWGGYLGEVLRGRWGGQWEMPDDGVMAGLPCMRIGGILLTPVGRVGKRLTYGKAEDVWAYALALQAQMESLQVSATNGHGVADGREP